MQVQGELVLAFVVFQRGFLFGIDFGLSLCVIFERVKLSKVCVLRVLLQKRRRAQGKVCVAF